jgi:hypothetical protein
MNITTIRDVDYPVYPASAIYLFKVSEIVKLLSDGQELPLPLIKEVAELIKCVFVPTIPDELIKIGENGYPIFYLSPNEIAVICCDIGIVYCDVLENYEETDKKQKKIYKDHRTSLELYKEEINKVLGKKKDKDKTKIPVTVE